MRGYSVEDIVVILEVTGIHLGFPDLFCMMPSACSAIHFIPCIATVILWSIYVLDFEFLG